MKTGLLKAATWPIQQRSRYSNRTVTKQYIVDQHMPTRKQQKDWDTILINYFNKAVKYVWKLEMHLKILIMTEQIGKLKGIAGKKF